MACRYRLGHLVELSGWSNGDGSRRDPLRAERRRYIAYRVVGRGPVDLVLLQGGFSHVELQLEEPSFARFLRRLASFSRLVVLDVRGTGLSDRTMHLPTLEHQVDDVLAVLDAAGCARAAVLGLGQGGVLASLLQRSTV
jgi:pimeloyl-ACP methyl ester carboxylesterase